MENICSCNFPVERRRTCWWRRGK